MLAAMARGLRLTLAERSEKIVEARTKPGVVAIWSDHEVGVTHGPEKRLVHSELGVMTLQCTLLHDLDQSQALLVVTATPGTDSYEKLQLLSVIGRQWVSAG